MGVAERRERDREVLRRRIVDAARDLLLEQGLAGLSMRAIAERIEYSPATIYIYFRDKDELVREVVHTGFELLDALVTAEVAQARESGEPLDEYGSMSRAYVRFALENPAYFRVMFELPATAELRCEGDDCVAGSGAADGLGAALRLLQRAGPAGRFPTPEMRRVTLMRWGLIHGLTTLYLAGQLRSEASTPEEFMQLIDGAMRSFQQGWGRTGTAVEA